MKRHRASDVTMTTRPVALRQQEASLPHSSEGGSHRKLLCPDGRHPSQQGANQSLVSARIRFTNTTPPHSNGKKLCRYEVFISLSEVLSLLQNTER